MQYEGDFRQGQARVVVHDDVDLAADLFPLDFRGLEFRERAFRGDLGAVEGGRQVLDGLVALAGLPEAAFVHGGLLYFRPFHGAGHHQVLLVGRQGGEDQAGLALDVLLVDLENVVQGHALHLVGHFVQPVPAAGVFVAVGQEEGFVDGFLKPGVEFPQAFGFVAVQLLLERVTGILEVAVGFPHGLVGVLHLHTGQQAGGDGEFPGQVAAVGVNVHGGRELGFHQAAVHGRFLAGAQKE